MPEATPRVSVVIPTWNAVAMLSHALAALAAQEYRDFEVVVVDNASQDGTAETVARDFPWVRVERMPRNVGFAGGVNAGIRASLGEIIVLLNNDTEVEPGWLAALVGAFDRHPEAGILASKVLMFDDRERIDSAGDQLGIFASQIGHGQRDGSPVVATEREVLTACAAAAAYRRQVFDVVGEFDERFFAYMEDVDLGIRAQLAGFRCVYVPEARVYHHASATSNRMPAFKFHHLYRNSLFLFFQYMPLGRLLLFGPAVLAWPVLRARFEGQPIRAGARVVRDFARSLPAVLARRRSADRERKISRSEFNRLLAPPLTRQPRGIAPE